MSSSNRPLNQGGYLAKPAASQVVRGTQSVVGQMGWVFARPSLTALEIAWRWLFGAPLFAVCWIQFQKILAILPPEAAGIDKIDPQNPWIAAVRLADAWDLYSPHVAHVAVWLAPVAAVAWILLSGIGRNLVIMRMEPRVPLRFMPMIVLQAAWLAALALTCWLWFRSVSWAAATHIGNGAEPDLVGYTVWVIVLSLGFFTLWALMSWVVAIAPMLLLLEGCSTASALGRSLRLGKPFTSKLAEINLVMGIVKLALLVVAMVFSSVLIPFSDEVGTGAMHIEWIVVSLAYFIASDYFHVVRIKGFIEFWRVFRAGPDPAPTAG